MGKPLKNKKIILKKRQELSKNIEWLREQQFKELCRLQETNEGNFEKVITLINDAFPDLNPKGYDNSGLKKSAIENFIRHYNQFGLRLGGNKMKFLDAIKEMKKGKKIRRTTWNEGHYWKMKDTEIVNNKDEIIEDWEVYTDNGVKCVYCKQPIHIDKFGGIKKEGLFCNSIPCLNALIREQEEAEARTTPSKG